MNSKLSADKKLRVLLVDDTLHQYLSMMCGLDSFDDMFKTLGLDAEVYMVETPGEAVRVLRMWAEKGHQADIVSADYHFGEGRRVLDTISDEDKKTPGLLPKKFFVHSKSGLNAYGDDEAEWTKETMKEVGADYCHTFELIHVGACSGGRASPTFLSQASTTSFRDYLRENYPVDLDSIALETNDKKFSKRAADVYRSLQADAGDSQWDDEPYEEPPAQRRTAWELRDDVKSGDLTKLEAIKEYDPQDAEYFRPRLQFDNTQDGYAGMVPFKGGTLGAAVGKAAFTLEEARRFAEEHQRDPENPGKLPPILVIEHLRTEHLKALPYAAGVVLMGKGSQHLPILCEGLGIPCIVGAAENPYTGNKASYQKTGSSAMLQIDYKPSRPGEVPQHWQVVPGHVIAISAVEMSSVINEKHIEGKLHPMGAKLRSLDPTDEYSFENANAMVAGYGDDVKHELRWHRKERSLRDCQGLAVKANADSLTQMQKAVDYGAEGIGLVRTENMFLREGSLEILQRAMLAEGDARTPALAAFEQAQTQELRDMFWLAAGESKKRKKEFPVTVRLLDAKPDELLPQPDDTATIAAHAAALGVDAGALAQNISTLRQNNERGNGFAKHHPDLYEAQVRAIMAAASEFGMTPEIMVPMVRTAEETKTMHDMVERVAAGRPYRFGVMVETVDAVKNAAEIAPHVQFMSFGTNDLTQEVLNVARNDLEGIERWKSANGTTLNPFRSIVAPVADHMRETIQTVQAQEDAATTAQRQAASQAALLNEAVDKARKANPAIYFGVCGQHATDRESVRIFQELYTHAISVPANFQSLLAARINTAQIAVEESEKAREATKSGAGSGQGSGGGISPANMPRGTLAPGSNTRDARNSGENQVG